jgi:hypothetical protein
MRKENSDHKGDNPHVLETLYDEVEMHLQKIQVNYPSKGTLDESLAQKGYEEYLEDAEQSLIEYNEDLERIMLKYKLKSEFEAITGSVTKRNRLLHLNLDETRAELIRGFIGSNSS